jgi:hypothetical protein
VVEPEPVVPAVAPPVVVAPPVPLPLLVALAVVEVLVPLSVEVLHACWSSNPLPSTITR